MSIVNIDESRLSAAMTLDQDAEDPLPSPTSKKSPDIHLVDEETPLLRTTSPPREGEVLDISRQTPGLNTRWIVPVCMLLAVLLQSGDQLMDAPFARVFESIYCYRYWEVHDASKLLMDRASVGPGAIGGVDEAFCKIPEVQAQVAALEGNLGLFNGIPSLVLAIPFGILADRWGRKPVILLGLVSFPLAAGWIATVCWYWQKFDVQLVLLSSLHGILGGSSSVISAIFLTVLSDVVPKESRATVFFQINSACLAMNFLAPPLAAFLMSITPWIPIFSGQVLQVIPIALMWFIPETLHHHRSSIVDMEATFPAKTKSSESSGWLSPLRDIGSMLLRDWRVPVLAATFLLHIYTQAGATLLLLQYASTRYLVSFSEATFVVSLRAGFTIGVYLVLLPLISQRLMKKHNHDAGGKDVILGRCSAMISSVGWMLVALSPRMSEFVVALFVLALGAGFATLVRSYLTSIIPRGDVAKLYTILSMLDTIGTMAAGPLFALLFKVGLGIGGNGLGLPFVCMALLYAACSVIMFCVRIRRQDEEDCVEDIASA